MQSVGSDNLRCQRDDAGCCDYAVLVPRRRAAGRGGAVSSQRQHHCVTRTVSAVLLAGLHKIINRHGFIKTKDVCSCNRAPPGQHFGGDTLLLLQQRQQLCLHRRGGQRAVQHHPCRRVRAGHPLQHRCQLLLQEDCANHLPRRPRSRTARHARLRVGAAPPALLQRRQLGPPGDGLPMLRGPVQRCWWRRFLCRAGHARFRRKPWLVAHWTLRTLTDMRSSLFLPRLNDNRSFWGRTLGSLTAETDCY